MRWLGSVTRRYPVVAVTVLVAVVGSVIALIGHQEWARWIISGFGLVVAAIQFWDMVKGLLRGRWGIDVLAIMAIVATVVVGEFWASLVIVLMLSGGEALEDYAAGRAKRELSALLARAPQIAHRFGGGTGAEDILVDEVVVGDKLLVKPSEIVPVDGVLLSDGATSMSRP